jgi:hypothetical protein
MKKEDRRALSDGNVENDRDFRTVVGKKGDFRFIRQTASAQPRGKDAALLCDGTTPSPLDAGCVYDEAE